jgi:hypothetical protein
MNSKDIEVLAVNAVRSSIAITDFLEPFIPDNDKGPSFDGYISIYDNKSKKKSAHTRRVPVQVKGSELKPPRSFEAKEVFFPVKMIDLRAYLYEGGIIFFLCMLMINNIQRYSIVNFRR